LSGFQAEILQRISQKITCEKRLSRKAIFSVNQSHFIIAIRRSIHKIIGIFCLNPAKVFLRETHNIFFIFSVFIFYSQRDLLFFPMIRIAFPLIRESLIFLSALFSRRLKVAGDIAIRRDASL